MSNEFPTEDAVPQTDISSSPSDAELRQQRKVMIMIVVVCVLFLAMLTTGIVLLLVPSTKPDTVARIRDVFIIVMALESLLIGVVLTILMIQLARLVNLLQNEVKPILDSTNETISNLRGTTVFLSNNLVEPVIKLNEYIAAIQKFTELLGINRKR